MDVLVMIGQIILGLSIIVTIHESGHFLAARLFGMHVEKFYLFFDAWGKKLFSVKRGETEYGVGWLPLGGYVKIAGMIDESMDTEQMKKEPEPWEFRSKPAWQRFIVMIAGVVLNFILGILIFSFITFSYGETYTPIKSLDHGVMAMKLGEKAGFKDGDIPYKVNGKEINAFSDIYGKTLLQGDATITVKRNGKDTTIRIPESIANNIAESGRSAFLLPRDTFFVAKVMKNSPADKAGLQQGDIILSVNGKTTVFFNQLKEVLENSKGEEVNLTIKRNNKTIETTAQVQANGKLGFYPNFDIETKTRHYGFFPSFERGATRAWTALSGTLLGLGKLITGDLDPTKSLQGPISIAKNIYGGTWNWPKFWEVTGLLSLIIGLMNILPIPALDGGHAMLLSYEMVFRKPVPDKVYQVIQMIGIIFILTLMVFVIFNDIWQVFIK